MKKLLLSALVFSAFAANAQVKKVILHDYTGAKCQFCTDGTVILEGLLAANPTTFIPVQIHAPSYTPASSALKTAEGDSIDAFADPAGYPAGSVDMLKYTPSGSTGIAMGRGSWTAAFNVQKAKPGIASVSINNRKKTGANTYEADIVVEFSALPTAGVPIAVNAFLLEDSIKADGANYTQTNFSGGPYGGASPLTYATHGYVHNNVLRKAIGGTWGYTTTIPATPVVGTKYTQKISFTIPGGTSPTGWVEKNVRLVAFVAYNSALNKEVINGEVLGVSKTFFPAGVQNTINSVNIMSAYPNPAKLGSVVNVEFDITNDEQVTMNVYSVTGQKVATPYISNDIKGGHFIQWKTGLDNLTPGTYIIELATATGRHTQKITLQ